MVDNPGATQLSATSAMQLLRLISDDWSCPCSPMECSERGRRICLPWSRKYCCLEHVTTGNGPAGTGTITLTFSGTFGTDNPVCTYEASDAGSAAWDDLEVMKDNTPTTASDMFTWTNGAKSTALASKKTYYVNYHCFAK